MEKLYRVSRVEHRWYQTDIFAESESEAIEKVRSNGEGSLNNVQVHPDHGTYFANEHGDVLE